MSSPIEDDPYLNKGMSDSRSSTPREMIATASLTNSLTDSLASIKYSEDDHKYSNNILEQERTSISFTPVERPNIGGDTFGDDFTSSALKSCKKTVLGPYHIFLKIIGWRRLSPSQEMTSPLHYKVFNIAWPIILTLLLIVSCATQMMVCFSRDQIVPPSNISMIHVQCKDHIVSTYILLDMLLISAYLYGVYIFRVKEPEHLSTFAETVFLGIISRRGIYSPRYLIKSLQFLMFLGLFWIAFSMLTSVLRLFAHHYFQIGENKINVTYDLIPINNDPTAQKWVVGTVAIVSILGFIVFDVAYTAVVINYSIQCQLMVYYLQSISTRIVDREWEIEQSIKEVHSARQFLSKLNSHMSKVTGVMMFIFLTSSFNSVYGLEELRKDDWNSHIRTIVATTFLSIIQWITWLFLPLIQAARVTRSGTWLLKTALQMRARPLTYRDTPQLDLDSFLLYCSNVQMKAKLFSIAISPGIVLGGAFVLGFVFYLVFNLPNDSFSWATWL